MSKLWLLEAWLLVVGMCCDICDADVTYLAELQPKPALETAVQQHIARNLWDFIETVGNGSLVSGPMLVAGHATAFNMFLAMQSVGVVALSHEEMKQRARVVYGHMVLKYVSVHVARVFVLRYQSFAAADDWQTRAMLESANQVGHLRAGNGQGSVGESLSAVHEVLSAMLAVSEASRAIDFLFKQIGLPCTHFIAEYDGMKLTYTVQ